MRKRKMIQGISLAVPAEMYDSLRNEAKQNDESLSAMVRQIVDRNFGAVSNKEEADHEKGKL